MRSSASLLMAFVVCLGWAVRPAAADEQRRPNVIFILADDLGYGDLGVTYQNSRDPSKPRFATPHLDAMAAEGILLRQHYTSAPVCAPARASLLLGQHQGNCAVRDNQFDKALPNNHTLATVLKQAGYHTIAIGKWGLAGKKPEYPAHPLRRGFDESFGFMAHNAGHTYYHDAAHPLYDGLQDVTAQYENVYSTDLFTARAKRFITEHQASKPGEPFFMYLAYTAVHNALEVPGEAYPAGAGKSGGVQWPLKPTPKTKDTYLYPEYAKQPWNDHMKRYATMARRLDDGVGDVLQLLKDLNIDQDTLVVFTSDNGPANEAGGDPRFFDSWGPFDGFKRDCWEGGVREPTIVRWPGRVPAGKVSDFVSGFWDWMPTLADAAGLAPPAQADGVSLMPTLTGNGTQRDKGYVYVEYDVKSRNPASGDVFKRKGQTGRGQQQMVRLGDFVAVRVQIESAGDPWRLFDVKTDPHEDHNLAKDPAHADLLRRVRDLAAALHRPNASAPRPYDGDLVPAVAAPAGLKEGQLDVAVFEGTWPWVPDFDALGLAMHGPAKGLDSVETARGDNVGLQFTGYLRVPRDGSYTLSVASDGGAEVWINEAHVLDDDFSHKAGAEVTEPILLKAGLHPFRLAYRHGTGPAKLELKYAGPGIEKQSVPASAFAAVPAR